MHREKTVIGIIAVIVGIASGTAGSRWEYTDVPSLDSVTAMVRCGNALLAGTENGIIRSIDSGTTWLPAGVDASSSGLPVEFFCPVRGDTVVVKSHYTMLTVDSGKTWRRMDAPPYGINSAAASSTRLFVSQTSQDGIMTSTDRGRIWLPAPDTGIIDTAILSLAVYRDTLFAGTRSNGIFMSGNNGANWIRADSGIPADTTGAYRAIYRLYADSNVFFALCDSGIYQYTGANRIWQRKSSGIPAGRIRFVATSGNRWFAGNDSGLFMTSDNGTIWTSISAGLPKDPATGTRTVFTAVIDGHVMYAGTRRGVYRSTDNGAWWAATGAMATVSAMTSLGNRIFAGGRQGIITSANNGQRWDVCDSAPRRVNALAARDTIIVAGSGDRTWEGRVFFSTDSGATWKNRKSGKGTFPESINSIAISDSGVFAGLNGFDGITRTRSLGTSWTSIEGDLVDDPYHSYNVNTTFLAANGTTLFATVYDTFYRTENTGINWIRSDSGITGRVGAFTVDGGYLFAGTPHGVFRSSAPGAKWEPLPSPDSITCIASTGRYLFAGTADSGVFFSENSGAAWIPLNSGLRFLRVKSLHYHAMFLYAGIDFGGIYRLSLEGIVAARMSPAATIPETPVIFRDFRRRIDIIVTSSKTERIGITVITLSGKVAAVVADRCVAPGVHSFLWDHAGCAPGLYLVQVTTGANIRNRLITLTR
jgi:hypothetical protein